MTKYRETDPLPAVLPLLRPGWIAFAVAAACLAAVAVAFPREAAAGGGQQPLPPITDAQRARFEQWFAAEPHVNLPVDPDGAKVLIVKFTDYQCPACAKTYLDYKPILAKYAETRPGEVKFVELDFPLNSACNAGVRYAMHPAACEAAVAVRLAREHGKADEMETWLAENHVTLTPESVKDAARTIAGVTDFDARYPSVIEAVKTDAALGVLNNVQQTPTFVINGTMMPPVPPQYFDMAITLELAKAER
jgi:protein-disulfide isomerase